jgi:SAM-dependent methyltransferase
MAISSKQQIPSDFRQLLERLESSLACPACMQSGLTFTPESATCQGCAANYPIRDDQIDLRLRSPKRYAIYYELGNEAAGPAIPFPHSIAPDPDSPVDYESIPLTPYLSYGNRPTAEQLSYLPHSDDGGIFLDLGCGKGDFRFLADYTGLDYVGLDNEGSSPILGDAHSLPFANESIDFVLAIAVLEHVRYPMVMMREVARVLKPGGGFIGSVAFLESFHLNSYFHASHLGTHNLMTTSGLEVLQMEGNKEWMGYKAQAQMSLFHGAPMLLAEAAVLPLDLANRLWWILRRLKRRHVEASEDSRVAENTGGFRFVCRKPVNY